MEGFRDAFDHPHKIVVRGGWDHALRHMVANSRHGVAETEWKRHQGSPCGVFQREGEVAWVLLGWLWSKGDAGLALKPPVVQADGGERLDGGVGQHQLSSHRDNEVQVTKMHVCTWDPADCRVSHPWPNLERAKAPT